MTLIEWKEEFSLGIPEIDHEHREMIDLINLTYSVAREGGGQERILDFLGEIYARISAHFALEEKIMREKNYDEYADHKAEHERLLDEILDITDECESGGDLDEKRFSASLHDWFALHFRTRDARLHKRLGI